MHRRPRGRLQVFWFLLFHREAGIGGCDSVILVSNIISERLERLSHCFELGS